MLDGMEDQAVRQVSAVGTVLLVVTRWQIVQLVQREQTALHAAVDSMWRLRAVTVHPRALLALRADMARRLRPHRNAQANVQQVDMPLIQQLLVQVQRTALHVRLADTVQVVA